MNDNPQTFIERIISNPIIRTIVIYVSGGWIVLEITEYLITHLGLNENLRIVLLIILGSVFPIAILISWLMFRKHRLIKKEIISNPYKEESKRHEKGLQRLLYTLKKPRIYFPIVFILSALLITIFIRLNHQLKVNRAREDVLPEIRNLIAQSTAEDRSAAFDKLKEIGKFLQNDQEYLELLGESSFKASVYTNPTKANIYIKDYKDFNNDWELLGTSPLDSVIVSRTWHRWKIEKPGFETVYRIDNLISDTITLDKAGSTPPGMVKIPGGSAENIEYLPYFYMDKYEVTNNEFKDFVEQGGYQNKTYWKHPFIKDGEVLSWDDAMSLFKDQTDRNGPSTWFAGDFLDGQESLPVTGVSWYEAAAFAQFKGKNLPSVYHWSKSIKLEDINVRNWYPSSIIPLSNFFGQGPISADSLFDMSAYGTFQMAGNVTEWCSNQIFEGRATRGGGWDSPHYMYHQISYKPAMDRSPQNGFRCVIYNNEDEIPEITFDSLGISATRNYLKEEPASDEIFKVYKEMFDYDSSEISAVKEYSDSSNTDWVKEKISFDAAYEDDRIISYLFLPKGYEPPYPTIIYLTPSLGSNLNSETQLWGLGAFDFMISNGYAVIHPIYYGDYERYLSGKIQWGPHEITEYYVKFIKDFRRTIDYLETRPDIDLNKLGSFGISRGASICILANSIENRHKISILWQGGLPYKSRPRPEVDAINFVTRINIPTLIINGIYDMIFPIDISVKPMYELMTTPEEDKKLVLTDTDHTIPEMDGIRESLKWLDKYLGPAKRRTSSIQDK